MIALGGLVFDDRRLTTDDGPKIALPTHPLTPVATESTPYKCEYHLVTRTDGVTFPRLKHVGFLLHSLTPVARTGLTEAPQAFCVSVCPTATV